MQSKDLIGFSPDWPAPSFVRGLMTTRKGGVSPHPWDSLNLGLFSGDSSENVLKNRGLVQSAMGVPAVYLKQVHGAQSVSIDHQTPSGLEADVAWTTHPGLACAVMAADCLPILVCHPKVKWVAAAHAGWRGLAGTEGRGVVETLSAGAAAHGLQTSDCIAWLGPCIGPTAFEVGEDVFQAFVFSQKSSMDSKRVEDQFVAKGKVNGNGKYWADLAGLARLRLQAEGFHVICGNDSTPAWCTHRQEAQYHSHRRDALLMGGTGRMAAYIWITA
jgi:YfiH family protein